MDPNLVELTGKLMALGFSAGMRWDNAMTATHWASTRRVNVYAARNNGYIIDVIDSDQSGASYRAKSPSISDIVTAMDSEYK